MLVLSFSCVPNNKLHFKAHTEIDFKLSGNWIFINLKLNQTDSLKFIIDSGVDETIINTRTAKLLKYKFDKKGSFSGALKTDSVYYSENNTIFIGNLKLDSLILVQIPLENLEQTFGVTIDGFIGEALFKKYIVNIDFVREKIQLYKDNIDFEQKDSLFPIDFNIINKCPVITTSFILYNNDSMLGNFMVDLGYRNAIAFNNPFIKKNKLLSKLEKFYIFNATGVIGAEKSYKTRMKTLKFGNQQLDSIPYMLSLSDEGTLSSDDYDGIIGMDILTRFASIGIDYKNKKMYLGKYIYKSDSIYSEVNCSGIELKKIIGTSKVIINAVYENSPASEAGLKEGDELIAIKGIEVNNYELTEIKKILRLKGKTIDLSVKRANKILLFKINLRELI